MLNFVGARGILARSGLLPTVTLLSVSLLSVSLLSVWILPAPALATEAGMPYLWKVESPGNPTARPSYLFGTIHSAHPQLNQLPDSVSRAFAQADAYFGELDMTPTSLNRAARSLLAEEQQSLLKVLTEDRQRRVNQVLVGIHPGLSLQHFAGFKLWAFTATLALLEDQLIYNRQPAMDVRLFNLAAQAGKRLGSLETIDEQAAVFETFSRDEMLQMLDATLAYMEAAQRQQQPNMAATYQAYRSGDTEQFQYLLQQQLALSQPLLNKLNQQLLIGRNEKMAERIIGHLRSSANSYFFAIGAAHFSGPSSIQQLLQARGYRVTRIRR